MSKSLYLLIFLTRKDLYLFLAVSDILEKVASSFVGRREFRLTSPLEAMFVAATIFDVYMHSLLPQYLGDSEETTLLCLCECNLNHIGFT